MTQTILDPTTALLVVDLREGSVGGPSVHPAGEVVERAKAPEIIDLLMKRSA